MVVFGGGWVDLEGGGGIVDDGSERSRSGREQKEREESGHDGRHLLLVGAKSRSDKTGESETESGGPTSFATSI